MGKGNGLKYLRADETQQVKPGCRRQNHFIKEQYQMTLGRIKKETKYPFCDRT
jgi:hypothetical protein